MGKHLVYKLLSPLFYRTMTNLLLPRRRGIEARRKLVTPVGAWFSQVGRLHQVHHLWQYAFVLVIALASPFLKHFFSSDLQTRKDLREKAWELDGWSETISKVILILKNPLPFVNLLWSVANQTAQLATLMDNSILTPLSFSPLK